MHATRPKASPAHSRSTHNNTIAIRDTGDLLMDAPDGYSWAELKMLAANRFAWRQRVNTLKQESRFTVKLSGKGGIVRRNFLKPTTHMSKRKPNAKISSASKYCTRDARAAFFRGGKDKTKPKRKKRTKPRHCQTKNGLSTQGSTGLSTTKLILRSQQN